MPLNAYTTNLPKDVLLNPGVLYIGATPIGVTRGGAEWDPGHEFENTDFDGKQAPIKGLDRKYYGEARLSGVILELGEASSGNQMPKLEPGVSAASAGSPNVTTLTPAVGGAYLAAGNYQSDIRLIFDRGEGAGTKRYFAIYLASALCTKYGPIRGGDTRKEAEIPFEFTARKDMASGTVGDAPYKYEYREALPS